MTGRLWNFINRVETALREIWYLRALCYAGIAAAIFLTWLFTGGREINFVYAEF